MNEVEVEITVQAVTDVYGLLEVGATLRTSPEYAARLVNESKCAKYVVARPDLAGDDLTGSVGGTAADSSAAASAPPAEAAEPKSTEAEQPADDAI